MKRLCTTLFCSLLLSGSVLFPSVSAHGMSIPAIASTSEKADKRRPGKAERTDGPILGTTVSLSGRVMTPGGRFIRNATLVLIDLDGPTQVAVSGSMGNYSFTGIVPGRTYVLGVFHPRFLFASPTQTIEINADQTNVILIGEEDGF